MRNVQRFLVWIYGADPNELDAKIAEQHKRIKKREDERRKALSRLQKEVDVIRGSRER